MDERTAACSCGQLRARCRGEPVRVSLCSRTACKQRTGSAFSCAAFPAPTVAVHANRREDWLAFGAAGPRDEA